MAHDPGTDEALQVVEDVAREAIERDGARISVEYSDGVGGWLIKLTPTNPRACAVSLAADYPPQIIMFLGPEPTTISYEFWRDDRPANLALLRELLEAVVTGRYQQNIETFKRDSITVTGRFDLTSGQHTHEETTRATSAVKPGETYLLEFKPY